MQDYFDAVHYLRELDHRPRKPYYPYTDAAGVRHTGYGLTRMRALLAASGNPQSQVEILNVTGTSGKGSVSKMLHLVFRESGRSVGSFYSPAITTMIEQIEINEQFIAPADFARIVHTVRPHVEMIAEDALLGPPSSFEVLLLITLLYSIEQACDVVILEGGTGGRYDACNIAERQMATVVTNVGLDHTDILGDTVEKVATDKVALLRDNSRLFTRSRDPRVLAILERAAADHHAIFYPVHDEIHVVREDMYGGTFGVGGVTTTLHVGGAHQMENAAIAYAVANMLGIERIQIETALERFFLAGRSEIVQREPFVMLDGAHNPDKIAALAAQCARFGMTGLHVVFGTLADKDIVHMLASLKPITKHMYVTATKSKLAYRAVMPVETVATYARAAGIPATVYERPLDALDAARAQGSVLVTGSMMLTGELRQQWYPEAEILERRMSRW